MHFMNSFFAFSISFRSSLIVIKLPKDFAIFWPFTFRKPVCSQYFTNGFFPDAASICAISASWWGKIKSRAPPCTSYCFPKYFSLIAVSSICHPGLPLLNQGSFQLGSSFFDFFQRQKSPLFLLFTLSSILVTASSASSVFLPESFPYSGNLLKSK